MPYEPPPRTTDSRSRRGAFAVPQGSTSTVRRVMGERQDAPGRLRRALRRRMQSARLPTHRRVYPHAYPRSGRIILGGDGAYAVSEPLRTMGPMATARCRSMRSVHSRRARRRTSSLGGSAAVCGSAIETPAGADPTVAPVPVEAGVSRWDPADPPPTSHTSPVFPGAVRRDYRAPGSRTGEARRRQAVPRCPAVPGGWPSTRRSARG